MINALPFLLLVAAPVQAVPVLQTAHDAGQGHDAVRSVAKVSVLATVQIVRAEIINPVVRQKSLYSSDRQFHMRGGVPTIEFY